MLVENGADVNSVNAQTHTPLNVAFQQGKHERL